MKSPVKYGVVAIIVMLLGGVGFEAWQHHWREAQEQALRVSVDRYWSARLINDLPTMYHQDAGFARDQLSPIQFMAGVASDIRILSYSIIKLEILGERAIVNVATKRTFPAIMPATFDTSSEETWVLINKEWFREPPGKPSVPNFSAPAPKSAPQESGTDPSKGI